MSHGIDREHSRRTRTVFDLYPSSRLLTESRGAKSLDGDVVEWRRRKKRGKEMEEEERQERKKPGRKAETISPAADGNDGAADLS